MACKHHGIASHAPKTNAQGVLVDKGNSAQSTNLLSYVCTNDTKGVAECDIGQEQLTYSDYP